TAQAYTKDKDKDVAAAARVVAAEIFRTTGRASDAQKDLEALYKDRPDDRAVRHQLALALIDQGKVKDAAPLLQRFMDEFDNRSMNLDDPEQLYYLAEAARLTSQYELANDSYREVMKLEPQMTRAGIAWSYLFLQKYASEHAEQTVEE